MKLAGQRMGILINTGVYWMLECLRWLVSFGVYSFVHSFIHL